MYRHLTMSELLALRDHEGTQVAQQHLEECDACATAFDRVHQRVAALRALPALQPPRDRWAGIRDAVVQERRGARWRHAGVVGLAAAAMLALFVGIQTLTTGIVNSESTARVELRDLIAESQRLETLLHEVEREPRVMTGMTAATIADLEDRIAVVDEGIAQATTSRYASTAVGQLWRERVSLMGTLVNTHVKHVAYVGY